MIRKHGTGVEVVWKILAARHDAAMAHPDTHEDERWMREALLEAAAAERHGDVPIGAVVVHAGRVIGRSRNEREHRSDPTAHAEILALRDAAAALGSWRVLDSTDRKSVV